MALCGFLAVEGGTFDAFNLYNRPEAAWAKVPCDYQSKQLQWLGLMAKRQA
jgi:hypothetical protein